MYNAQDIISAFRAQPAAVEPAKSPAELEAFRRDKFFTEKFNFITTELIYNPEWENGTGYFDYLLKDDAVRTQLKSCEQARCIDPNGRRMIVTQTLAGLVVVFERYSDRKGTFVHQSPYVFKSSGLIMNNSLNVDDLEQVVGAPGAYSDNIGNRVADIAKAIAKNQASVTPCAE